MSLPQEIYELEVKGLKRTISNIIRNDDDCFEAYYYNYVLKVEWQAKKYVATVKTPANVFIVNSEYPSRKNKDKAIAMCVEKILAHYNDIRRNA